MNLRSKNIDITFKSAAFKSFGLGALLFVLLCTSACKSEKDEIGPLPETYGKGFYVVNEGNFTVGNASLSYYSFDSAKMFNHLFFLTNNAPLGDVALSMSFLDDMAYIVVNNSGHIYKINRHTAAYEGKITGLISPRHMYIVDDEKAFISDLQDDRLTIVNPTTGEFLGHVELGKSSEAMLLTDNKLFVANWSNHYIDAPNNTIQVIDLSSLQLTDSIHVVREPNSMVLDKNKMLWALCSGGFMNEEQAALFQIDPVHLQILQVFTFNNLSHSPQHLSINHAADSLYYLNNGVFRMSIKDDRLPERPFIPLKHRNFYSLAIEPEDGQILVTDASNYMQDGFVFRFRHDGTLVDSLRAGIIPGQIRFNH